MRTWCDGGALLMLLRLAGPAPFDGCAREPDGTLPYAAIPELVATAVRVQTGCELAVGSWSVEAELGLVMFVFRLPSSRRRRSGSPPRAGSARRRSRSRAASRRRRARAVVAHVEPGAERRRRRRARPPAERERLRLVADERERATDTALARCAWSPCSAAPPPRAPAPCRGEALERAAQARRAVGTS